MVAKPIPDQNLSRLADAQPTRIDYRTRGRTGLRAYGGFVLEEELRALQGTQGLRTYTEMGSNDATCSTILYLVDKVVRQVRWRVKRVSDHPRDRAAADFLEECQNDLDTTWIDFISEVLTMLQYGFSVHEITYKRRCGNAPEPWMASRFKDGRVGWRGFPIRAQETIHRWLNDEMGNICMIEQIAPPLNAAVAIPMDKLLLFRTSTHKGNPLGKSIFRGAWRAWYLKRGIENIEGVGIERDLAGLPVAKVPVEVLNARTDQDAAMLEAMKTVITNIRRDEQEGVVFPLDYDEAGRERYKLELLTSGGTRNFDTDRVISRYDSRIAMCALADFLLLGQAASAQGSWAMHSDKSKMFAQSMRAFLDMIGEVINRFAVRRLFELNTFAVDEYPAFEHDDVEAVDLKAVGEFLRNVTGAGAALFPNPPAEARLMEMAGLPASTNPERDAEVKEPLGSPGNRNIEEVHEGDAEPAPLPGQPIPGAAASASGEVARAPTDPGAAAARQAAGVAPKDPRAVRP